MPEKNYKTSNKFDRYSVIWNVIAAVFLFCAFLFTTIPAFKIEDLKSDTNKNYFPSDYRPKDFKDSIILSQYKQFEGMNQQLERLSEADGKSIKNVLVPIGFLIAAILTISASLITKIESIKIRMDEYKESLDVLFVEYVEKIYDEIEAQIMDKKRTKHLTIDVLSFTLHQTSHRLKSWAEKEKLKNITLNLYHLDPVFMAQSPQIPRDWPGFLSTNKQTIVSYRDTHSQALIDNKVSINFYSYTHFPAVHGVQINEKLFVSIPMWDDALLIKTSEQAEYIKINADNKSPLAKRIRILFTNWIIASKASSEQRNAQAR